jgi:PKD repeat protein
MLGFLRDRKGSARANRKSRSSWLALQELETRELLSVTIGQLLVPVSGAEGDLIGFQAQASTTGNSPLTYNWTFGDGGTASGVNLTNPTHAYASPVSAGSPYTVGLTVSDGTSSASSSGQITIYNVAPAISAGPIQTVRAGSTAQFTAGITDAGGTADITGIQWDFNYSGVNFNPDSSANNNPTPSHVYTTAGSYIV